MTMNSIFFIPHFHVQTFFQAAALSQMRIESMEVSGSQCFTCGWPYSCSWTYSVKASLGNTWESLYVEK